MSDEKVYINHETGEVMPPEFENFVLKIDDIHEGELAQAINDALQDAAFDMFKRDEKAPGPRVIDAKIRLEKQEVGCFVKFQVRKTFPADPMKTSMAFVENGNLVKTTGVENIMKQGQLTVLPDRKSAAAGDKE